MCPTKGSDWGVTRPFVGQFLCGTRVRVTKSRTVQLAQWPKAHTNLFREELRLFPRREVPALVELVVVDELRVRLLRPTPRERIELVGENADGDRDSDASDAEE